MGTAWSVVRKFNWMRRQRYDHSHEDWENNAERRGHFRGHFSQRSLFRGRRRPRLQVQTRHFVSVPESLAGRATSSTGEDLKVRTIKGKVNWTQFLMKVQRKVEKKSSGSHLGLSERFSVGDYLNWIWCTCPVEPVSPPSLFSSYSIGNNVDPSS
jgi:hypothetical protein